MATRRIRNISSSNYASKLKVAASNKVVLSQSSMYSQLLYRQSHRAANYDLHTWIKFDASDFDGVQIVGFLMKNNKEIVHSSNCTFKIYGVDINDYTETLLITKTGVLQPDGKFTAIATQAELGSVYDLDGEKSLLIEAELFRFNTSYKMREYLNHLGIFDSFLRLKKRVDFLQVTKEDI